MGVFFKQPVSKRSVHLAALLSIALLTGCAIGIKPGQSPSAQMTVPFDVQTVYDRALAQTRYCLVTEDNFPVKASLSSDRRSGQIEVLMSFTHSVLSKVEMQAVTNSSTRVDIQMWGENVWDQTAIDAMKAAIEFGTPSCVNYFPDPESKNQTVIKQRR